MRRKIAARKPARRQRPRGASEVGTPQTSSRDEQVPRFKITRGSGEPGFDPELDWQAWRAVFKDRRPQLLGPSSPEPIPTPQALHVARAAARSPGGGAAIDEATLKLAAALTCRFGQVSVFGVGIGLFRWDVLVDALNRYPDRMATALRWISPALRNLIRGHRETPDDLWDEWQRDYRQRFELSVHPRSPCRAGSAICHTLLDYENLSLSPPVDRTAFQRWQIRAHLFQAETPFTDGADLLSCPDPPYGAGRRKELVGFACSALDGESKRHFVDVVQPLRAFFLAEASAPHVSEQDSKAFRDALRRLDKATLRGLRRRHTLELTPDQVRVYDKLLWRVREFWKSTKNLIRRSRLRRRLEMICSMSGITAEGELRQSRPGRPLEEQPAREVAAFLLCVQEELGPRHPQTIFEALARARRVLRIDESPLPGERRGRPPRPKNI